MAQEEVFDSEARRRLEEGQAALRMQMNTERQQRLQEFLERALLASIQGGGFEVWRARRWSSNTIGYNEATREEWAESVKADAIAAFERVWPSPK